MSKHIQFKFDANQEHQKQAIDSIVQLFEGFPKIQAELTLSGECIPNMPSDQVIDEAVLFNNMADVLSKNGLATSATLNVDRGFMHEIQGRVAIGRYPSFTVEMETGTGKTYAYLRTMHELRRQYGFSKFIVVVPSVAIYEGVIKAIDITREHFRTLYHNENLDLIKYDGSQLGKLRDFAYTPFLTVMVMTIAAFNKTTNNIYKPTEKLMGEKLPYQYIQETRPILILDECQKYETEKSKKSLRTLNPLFALKYSATAGIRDGNGTWNYDNLIYQLNPFEAFRRNLVKRIQVFGITSESHANAPAYFSIKEMNSGPKVKADVIVSKNGRRELGSITLKHGDNLHTKTRNDDYEGFIVENIDLNQGLIEFANGALYRVKSEYQEAEEKKEIFKQQIKVTVKQHMELQDSLFEQGIKVLSLFFIDRVANYRGENALIRDIFEEVFNSLKGGYEYFKNKDVDSVHDGYFAQKKTKEGIVEIDTEEGGRNEAEREAEKRAFELIMQKKEQLLSFDEDTCLIFTHSALQEGWDNPNVFQICTLAQRHSERRKRQEIGRGMRLCVDQNLDRVLDANINTLSVIANESYEDFVSKLQSEYQEDGSALPPPPTDAAREAARRNDKVFSRKEFTRFWDRLIQQTCYEIQIDTDALINDIVAHFSKDILSPPEIMIKRGMFNYVRYQVTIAEVYDDKIKINISKKGTDGEDEEHTKICKLGSSLATEFNDAALENYRIKKIDGKDVWLSDELMLPEDESLWFDVQSSIVEDKSVTWEKRNFPVFNLIERAAMETFLTRRTILNIFERISDDRKKLIFQNPEGFSSAFIHSIRDVLSNHIAENIEYALQDEIEKYDLDKIFPEEEKHPQRQLVKGSEASLYDYVQYESEVENRFVQNRLNTDKKVVLYFKFPDSFKVKLPKIIGNYVPDWGVIRRAENGDYLIELVRETKSTMHENLLQYANEKRKIWCAKKHFDEIGVDYRHITDEVINWWEPDDHEQLRIDSAVGVIDIFDEIEEENKFITHLPIYPLRAVATSFLKEDYFHQPSGWVKVETGKKLDSDMFVAQVVGKSMEPKIPDGSYCVFRANPAGSRQGKIVLAQHQDISDSETGGSYTIKTYESEKAQNKDGTWSHTQIHLKPVNPDYDIIELNASEEDDVKIIAEFIVVVNSDNE